MQTPEMEWPLEITFGSHDTTATATQKDLLTWSEIDLLLQFFSVHRNLIARRKHMARAMFVISNICSSICKKPSRTSTEKKHMNGAGLSYRQTSLPLKISINHILYRPTNIVLLGVVNFFLLGLIFTQWKIIHIFTFIVTSWNQEESLTIAKHLPLRVRNRAFSYTPHNLAKLYSLSLKPSYFRCLWNPVPPNLHN